MVVFIEYPKCSTCQKAKKWLIENNIEFQDRHIVQEPPTAQELHTWVERSGLAVKRFINTSGRKYKDLGLKDKIPEMTQEQIVKLLATDGMLVKRPLLVGEDFVIPGFQAEQWKEKLG